MRRLLTSMGNHRLLEKRGAVTEPGLQTRLFPSAQLACAARALTASVWFAVNDRQQCLGSAGTVSQRAPKSSCEAVVGSRQPAGGDEEDDADRQPTLGMARLGSDGAAPDQVRGKLYRSEDCQDDKEHWSELKRGLTLARAECEVTGTVKPWREVCHEMRAHVYKDCRFNGSSSVLPMWVPMLRHGGDPRLISSLVQ